MACSLIIVWQNFAAASNSDCEISPLSWVFELWYTTVTSMKLAFIYLEGNPCPSSSSGMCLCMLDHALSHWVHTTMDTWSSKHKQRHLYIFHGTQEHCSGTWEGTRTGHTTGNGGSVTCLVQWWRCLVSSPMATVQSPVFPPHWLPPLPPKLNTAMLFSNFYDWETGLHYTRQL